MFSKTRSGAHWAGGIATAGMFLAAIWCLASDGIPPLEEGRTAAILLFIAWAFFLWASISTETRAARLCTKIASGVGLGCGVAAALLAHDPESLVLNSGVVCALLSFAICFAVVIEKNYPVSVYFIWRVGVTYALGFGLALMVFTDLRTAVLALGSFALGMVPILIVAAARGLNNAASQIEKASAAPEPEAEGQAESLELGEDPAATAEGTVEEEVPRNPTTTVVTAPPNLDVTAPVTSGSATTRPDCIVPAH